MDENREDEDDLPTPEEQRWRAEQEDSLPKLENFPAREGETFKERYERWKRSIGAAE